MAKKKEKAEKAVSYTPANVDKLLDTKFGDGIFISGDAIIERPRVVIPVAPSLNMGLSGGIPEGSFCVITGPPKVGKTTMCLHYAGNAQKMEYATDLCPDGRMVYFFNIEGRLGKKELAGIQHLQTSPDRFKVITSKPGKILSAEDYLEILLALIHTKPGAIFVIDSISQLCSQGRMTAHIGDRYRDDVPLMLASLTKQVANVLPVNNSVLMCITHEYANQDVGSKKKYAEASGRKVQYQADVKLRASHKTPYPENSDDMSLGQTVHWQVQTSALGPPNAKCDSLLRYGLGLDEIYEMSDIAVDIGIISKGGAWYTVGEDEKKIQGKEKLIEWLRENPDEYAKINAQVNEMLGV